MPAATATPVVNAKKILDELRPLGRDSYKKVLMNHGITEPFWGVKIEDMKKIQKRHKIKKDYQLALDLYASGVYDAMYMAGLIADETKMTKKDLQKWAQQAHVPMLCSYTVAWVAAESNYGWELGLEWIESKKESIATAGWNTLSGLVALREDDELDIAAIKKLLQRVAKTIHDESDGVRYTMNGFVIAVGCYVKPLMAEAVATAKKIGEVEVDMGDTACKVPDAIEYINKVKQRGTLGKKRKTVRC